jgi:CheY-like chemotaxis protein
MNNTRDHVLVVDDNQDVANSLVEAITRYGYPAKAVYSGEDAVRETANFLPDMVLVDLSMPELDGYETITRMRQKRPAAEIIMVAVTGLSGDEHRQRAYDAGFDLFASKPLGADKLKELLALLDPTIATSTRANKGVRARRKQELENPY